ncbi:MAG TPA: ABC transporter substrate-binding protein [Thermoanaerobaculia bacterium]|nr:ABC transporter substrate-binding protein [Thermoanaerobaculia bacterium]
MRAASLALLALLLAPSPRLAAADPPAAPAPWPPRYANAPEELVPYRRVEPYQKYFTEPLPFYGPGRDYPDPPGLKTLRVGLLAPSPASADAARGAMMRRSVEMAVDEANASAKPGELPFELVVREDSPLWGSAANILVDLAFTDECLAVVGSIDSTATHVALRVALKAEIFMVNTGSCDQTVTETFIPWLMRTWPDDRQHGYRLAELVVKEQGHRRVALLRTNDRNGRVGVKTFVDSVRRLGHPVLQEMRFLPGAQSFDTQVSRIKAAGPDAVVLWGEPEDAGHAAAALRKAGVTVPLYGPERVFGPALLAAAAGAAEGMTITYPFDPTRTDPAWTAFVGRFRKRAGTDPDAFAAYAYDGARILLRAIRTAGPNRFRIRDAVAAVRTYDGVTGRLVFDPTFNNLAPLTLVRVKGDAFTFEKSRADAK